MAESTLLPVSDGNWIDLVTKCAQPTVVLFGAAWCGPATEQLEVLEELAGKHPEFTFFKYDVDLSQHQRSANLVEGIPTTIVFKNGGALERLSGFRAARTIEAMLARAIAKPVF